MKLGSEVPYTDRGPLIRDSVIAAYVPDYENQASSKLAIVLPWSEGFSIKVRSCVANLRQLKVKHKASIFTFSVHILF